MLIVLGLNFSFWSVFWISVGSLTVRYEGPFQETHGNLLPEYVWLGRALPASEETALFMRLARSWHRPAYDIARTGLLAAFDDTTEADGYYYEGQTYLGTSYAGYQIVATMILSFGQWSLIAAFLGRLSRLMPGRKKTRRSA